jgi:acyl carrier protein
MDAGRRQLQDCRVRGAWKEILVLFDQVREILSELLDVEVVEITPESFLVRDLGMESIDFLELAVALNQRFKVPIHDDTLFLRNLRLCVLQAREGGQAVLERLKDNFGFLSEERLEQILTALDAGPVIQVRDLVSYIRWQMKNTAAA